MALEVRVVIDSRHPRARGITPSEVGECLLDRNPMLTRRSFGGAVVPTHGVEKVQEVQISMHEHEYAYLALATRRCDAFECAVEIAPSLGIFEIVQVEFANVGINGRAD